MFSDSESTELAPTSSAINVIRRFDDDIIVGSNIQRIPSPCFIAAGARDSAAYIFEIKLGVLKIKVLAGGYFSFQ